MKYALGMVVFLLITYNASAEEVASNSRCRLVEKKLNLIQSELDVVIERYKIAFKKDILPKIRSNDGQPKQIKIGSDNPLVKAIQNLSVAVATYTALKEDCYENPVQAKAKDEFSATIIPNDPKASETTK